MIYEACHTIDDVEFKRIYTCDRPQIAAQKLFSFIRKKHTELVGPINITVWSSTEKKPYLYETIYSETKSLYTTHKPVAKRIKKID
jgi:hypothetical protein